jgi:hypothetical protein
MCKKEPVEGLSMKTIPTRSYEEYQLFQSDFQKAFLVWNKLKNIYVIF